MKIICLFTTGRTGTAFLSQIFGMKEYNGKRQISINDGVLVSHELFSDYPIREIKKFGVNATLKLQRDYLNSQIEKLQQDYDFDRLFVTDHKIGRFFYSSLDKFFDCKMLYIVRSYDNVTKSFYERFLNYSSVYPERSDLYWNDMWENSFYQPTDYDSIQSVTDVKWAKMQPKTQLRWYCLETQRRWRKFKKTCKVDYLELPFEALHVRLNVLSNFIDLKYDPSLVNVKVNLRKKWILQNNTN